MTNVLVEGGGRVLGSFLDAGQVDAVDVFIAPILEGGDHARTAARGRGSHADGEALRLDGIEVSRVGGDVRIRGRLPQPWRIERAFGRLSDLDHSGGRALQSLLVMAWILPSVHVRCSDGTPFSAAETRR